MILYYYVLREFFRYTVGVIVLCVFLFLMFDFLHKTTKYIAKYQAKGVDLFLFYLYQIPSVVLQVLPIASLLASVITMVLLSRSNEVTAMRAAGMGPLRIGIPIAAGGLILSFVALGISEMILPKTAQKMHYVQQVKIEGEDASQITDGARWFRDEDRLINFVDYDPHKRIMTSVKIIDVTKTFRPKQAVEAKTATYEEETRSWRLDNIKTIYFDAGNMIEFIDDKKTMMVKLPVEPSKLRRERRLPNELSFGELTDVLKAGEASGTNVSDYEVDFHVKLAYPFAAFVVSLIGLKFGFRSERSLETAKSILFAFAVGISYWILMSSGRALGRRGDLPAVLAAWMPNLAVFAIAALMIWRSRKPA